MSRNPDRRALITSGGAALLAACGWDGGPAFRSTLQGASRFNDWFSERIFSPERLARKYEASDRSSSFPNYHISRMTPSLSDPDAWRLEVAGLVRTPLTLSLDEIRGLGGITYTIGVGFYVWDRLPYNHAIWHGFVMGGSALHFTSVLGFVVPG